MSIANEITRINTNIAASYAACRSKGAVMPQTQNSANLPATISGIGAVERKDVNFYDYDGTLLYSYTAQEAATLTAPPVMPRHAGLVSQGWTHTIGEIITEGQNGRALDVGATYTTADTSTNLYFFVKAGTRIPQLRIYVTMAANRSATVQWGDGGNVSVFENPSSGAAELYVEKTDYAEAEADTVICVKISGGSFRLGRGGGYNLFGVACGSAANSPDIPVLIKAELGSNCTGIMQNAFYNAYGLKTVSMHGGITSIGSSAFVSCSLLKAIVIPDGITGIEGGTFLNCYSLTPVIIPNSVTSIGSSAFNSCNGLADIVIPDGTTGIGNYAFNSAKNLMSAAIPNSVASIGIGAFYGCYHLCFLDLRAFTDPSNIPSLFNTDAFSNTPSYLRFKVANQEMLTAFSNATNWAAYASQFEVIS